MIIKIITGWILRVYSPLGAGDVMGNVKLKTFFADYPFVDLCNVTRVLELHNISQSIFPMTWRFLPLLDPMVDAFVSRDCDTLMTKREAEAVRLWLTNSSVTFHMMRDHTGHCGTAILGGELLCPYFPVLEYFNRLMLNVIIGGWGAKINQERHSISMAAYKMFYGEKHSLQYGFDQVLLFKFIWPLTFGDSVIKYN